MENLEQSHETLKTYMYSMKEQMAKMMEALNLIKSKLESSNSFTKEGVSCYPRASHQDGMRVQNSNTHGNVRAQIFPQYGLPIGYTPPIVEYSERVQVMPSTRHVNNVAPYTNINEDHVQGLTSHKPLPHSINGNVVGSLAVHVILGDGAHIVESEAIAEDVKVRDKLEILEERLIVIEGVGNYGLGDVVNYAWSQML